MKLQKQQYIFITKWLLYWLGVLGIYLLILTKNGVTYLSSSLVISCYYLGLSVLAIFIFSKAYKWKQLVSLVSLVILGSGLGVLLSGFLKPLTVIQLDSLYEYHFYYPMLHFSSSISKLFEVLFQQVMIYLMVDYLFKQLENKKKAINNFALIFVILHLPLLFIFSHIGLIFIIPSVFAGFTFSYLMLSYRKGYLVSYLIHFLFYIGIAVFTRLSGLSVYDLIAS